MIENSILIIKVKTLICVCYFVIGHCRNNILLSSHQLSQVKSSCLSVSCFCNPWVQRLNLSTTVGSSGNQISPKDPCYNSIRHTFRWLIKNIHICMSRVPVRSTEAVLKIYYQLQWLNAWSYTCNFPNVTLVSLSTLQRTVRHNSITVTFNSLGGSVGEQINDLFYSTVFIGCFRWSTDFILTRLSYFCFSLIFRLLILIAASFL